MVKLETLIQLKAFSRQDGALLSLLWIASFACIMYLPASPLGNLLALATPIFVGWRLVEFRNYALDGAISLRRGFAYSVYTFFYASAIFAVAQYIYFKFLDGGRFLAMLTEAMESIAPVYKDMGMGQNEWRQNVETLTVFTPIQWAFMFMMQNIMIGITLSLPIAAVCARHSGRATRTKRRHNQ